MIPKVFITTFNKYYWCLRPYIYLFQTYWSTKQPAIIGGYEPLPFSLPPNFTFHSIADESYPKNLWLKGVIEFFSAFDDRLIIWSLEDYWLVRPIDHGAIRTLSEYMLENPDVLRIDLTTDRLFAGKVPRPHEMKDIMYGHYDLIESNKNNYHFSTQMAIWNRAWLVRVLTEIREKIGDKGPWKVETEGSTVLREEFPDLRVLGSRQNPVRYTIGIKISEPDETNTTGIPEEHIGKMKEMGYFDRGV